MTESTRQCRLVLALVRDQRINDNVPWIVPNYRSPRENQQSTWGPARSRHDRHMAAFQRIFQTTANIGVDKLRMLGGHGPTTIYWLESSYSSSSSTTTSSTTTSTTTTGCSYGDLVLSLIVSRRSCCSVLKCESYSSIDCIVL